MTISTTESRILVAGNSSNFSFSFNFVGDSSSVISVTYIDASGNETVLQPSQYTLSLNAAAPNQLWGIGGSVTYPLSGPAIVTGTYLQIQRTLPLTQETSVQNQGNYYAQVTELALDILEMQIQQVSARTGQIRGIWASGIQYAFGDIVVDGANGNNTGNYYACAIPNLSNVWATDLAAGDWSLAINVQIIAGYATSAAASAATATTEAGIATTEAGIATTQAGIATTQAGIATTQAGIATTQATNAASSATSAASSATSAAASAATAATYAGVNSLNTFSGNGVTTNFTLSSSPSTKNNVQVYISGVYQDKATFSVSGTTLTFTGGAPATGTNNIEAIVSTAAALSSGTVTSVSVASANGFAGTVATATTTPAITISTSITGIIKGNGNAISAAVSDVDYQAPITLTTTGTTGVATFSGNILNIPNYVAVSYTAGTGLTLTGGVFSITNTAVTAASYGSSTSIPSFTVNAQGQLTAAAGNVVIAPAGTLTGTTLASNVVTSSITSVGSGIALGTPASGVLTNCTGTASGLTAGLVTAITGQVSAGTNVTVTGSGTVGSPYVITSTSTAATAFSALTGSTNTSAAMIVGTGASLAASGSGTITATATPISGVTGLGTGVATFLATPSSANLASALTTSTGTGNNVFATSPTLVTPLLGTPTSGVLTNCTGTAAGLTAGTVTTNANMTGDVTSSGSNATTVAKIAGVSVGTPTGTGNVVFSNSPTLVTPALGTPASGNLVNCTGYPVVVNGVSTFSGNGATTAFTLGGSPTSKNNTLVHISGVYQNKANYTLAGAVVTFTTAPASGTSNIEVVYS